MTIPLTLLFSYLALSYFLPLKENKSKLSKYFASFPYSYFWVLALWSRSHTEAHPYTGEPKYIAFTTHTLWMDIKYSTTYNVTFICVLSCHHLKLPISTYSFALDLCVYCIFVCLCPCIHNWVNVYFCDRVFVCVRVLAAKCITLSECGTWLISNNQIGKPLSFWFEARKVV